jgi:hypothetical protein
MKLFALACLLAACGGSSTNADLSSSVDGASATDGGVAFDGASTDASLAPLGNLDAGLVIPPPSCAASQAIFAGGADPDYDFEYEDDVCHTKVYPSNVDRTFTCPLIDDSLAGFATATTALSSVAVDEQLLADVPSPFAVAVILIRRDGSGVPHYRYFGNGQESVAAETWSSSKFLEAANAAANLRITSSYAVGLDAFISDSGTQVPLGDLVTIVASYDATHYTSNALAHYFANIGGRARAQDLVHTWLDRPSESFGGNYGEAARALPYVFTEAGGASVTMTDDDESGIANTLSPLTEAEAMKRLAMHREDASTRLPGIQFVDLQSLFYGPVTSAYFPSRAPAHGGLSADTASYLQSAVDIAAVEQRTNGGWRIFSKLGFGDSADGAFLDTAYGCLPGIAADGRGLELVISTRLTVGSQSTAVDAQNDALVEGYYRLIVQRLLAVP